MRWEPFHDPEEAQPLLAFFTSTGLLLAPAMRRVVASDGNIIVVGPPKSPHLPGLKYAGLDERLCSAKIASVAPRGSRLALTEERGTMRPC